MPFTKPSLNNFIEKGIFSFVVGEDQNDNNKDSSPALEQVLQHLQSNQSKKHNDIFIFCETSKSIIEGLIKKYKMDNISNITAHPFYSEEEKTNLDEVRQVLAEKEAEEKEVDDNEELSTDQKIEQYQSIEQKYNTALSTLKIPLQSNHSWLNIIKRNLTKSNIQDINKGDSLLFICVDDHHVGMYGHTKAGVFDPGLARLIQDNTDISKTAAVTTTQPDDDAPFYKPDFKNKEIEAQALNVLAPCSSCTQKS
ncbi:hypothetical protein [Caedibacter taeniospiralis]|uniref:Uncharacterized protein n=1 Tax=Caedibacter taeniospiralis TaxID=28907 RepID=Q6TFD1_CAETA|nr:hypothetical protein [Caedibacter taeniospiralis]AAR87128.1 hypothetical protein [Caedibacter taeniospiralis]